MIALDSNIFIYFLEQHPEFGEASRQLFEGLEKSPVDACASELVFFETLAYPKLSDRQAAKITRLLKEMGVGFVQLAEQTHVIAAKLRRQHGFGPLDALHVACALQAGATHFVTNDHQVLKKRLPGIKIVALADSKATLVA